ncbi:MAG TPA: LamG domain-containing protein [Fimbriimonas sp.]
MLELLPILAACVVADRPIPPPILRLGPDGLVGAPSARLRPGTHAVSVPLGVGFAFTGSHPGIEIADDPRLALTKSMTIAAWLYLDAYTNEHNSAPGSQVLFRGDDRYGLDPYGLTVLADGTVAFAVADGTGKGVGLNVPISLRSWTHVVGSLDDATGQMKLWLNGLLAAQTVTYIRPFGELDKGSRPGLGIGNVQAASGGAHNQPFHGILADLRLYDQALNAAEAGWKSAEDSDR